MTAMYLISPHSLQRNVQLVMQVAKDQETVTPRKDNPDFQDIRLFTVIMKPTLKVIGGQFWLIKTDLPLHKTLV